MKLTLCGRTSTTDLDVLFTTSCQQWPSTVIKSTNGLQAQRLRDAWHVTFAAHVAPLQQFVLYESDAAYRFWELGRPREPQLIFIDFRDQWITLTVDGVDSSAYGVASASLAAVEHHRDNQESAASFWQRRW